MVKQQREEATVSEQNERRYPPSGPVTVTAVAFQHRTPGEGVGGFEWDVDADEARRRIGEIAGVYEDPNYETFERVYVFDRFDKDAITDAIDAMIWYADDQGAEVIVLADGEETP